MMSREGKSKGANEADFEQERTIVHDYPAAKANLAVLGDKKFLFNETQSSFVMYGTQGRSWIALGDPIGPPEEAPALIRRFYQAVNSGCANTSGQGQSTSHEQSS